VRWRSSLWWRRRGPAVEDPLIIVMKPRVEKA
jgi:hypothetical protein